MTDLLTIRNLELDFADTRGDRPSWTRVLHRVSLSLQQGETHALVGESGSGKSVTAMSVLRLLEEVSQVRTSGSIRFTGRELLDLPLSALRSIRGNEIAMIFQEPMTSLNPVYTIGNQLQEPLLLHRHMDRDQAWRHSVALLERCGIRDPESRMRSYPHQLSGGQRQRVMIAMALACRPKLLIADEPTTALDVTIQGQILDLIMDVQQEFGMAVLLITHDLPMVRRVASTVSIMHQGRIVEQGLTGEIFTRPRRAYTRTLLKSLPSGRKTVRLGGEPLIRLKNIACHFTLTAGQGWLGGPKTVLKAVDNVSLTVREGSTLGIVGESGSGKSTLATCLLRLTPCSGRILYHRGQEVVDLARLSNRRMRPLRRELQIVFQDPFSSLSPRMSVEQIIGEGLQVHRMGTRAEQQRLIAQALEEVELEPDMADRYPHEFSGGQRQRIAIARAIVMRPRLLILDEPTSALDMTIQAQIIDLLRRLQKKHSITTIFITHDLRVIRSLADELAVMQQGKIVETGPADQLFDHPGHPYTRSLFEAVFPSEPPDAQS